jgi:hypothetical protein
MFSVSTVPDCKLDVWGLVRCRTSNFLLAVANSQCHPPRRRKLQWASRTAFLMMRQLEREAARIISNAEVTK